MPVYAECGDVNNLKKHITYLEKRWPDTPEFNSLLKNWNSSGSVVLLKYIWKGYDLFCQEILSEINCSQDDEDLERSITQLLEPLIRQAMTGYEPFEVQHGPYEYETRKKAPAQPPQYDIAFIWRNNPRIMWPLEAKVLQTDRKLAEYITEIKSNFLTGRYAPFSNEGGMLGYLIKGSPKIAFSEISKKLKRDLSIHPCFKQKNHKVSTHKRRNSFGSNYSHTFCCHHIIFQIESPKPQDSVED